MSIIATLPNARTDIALVSRPVSPEWTEEQRRLITSVLASNLTESELRLFAQVCQRTGLDPFTRQIYAIKRRQRQDGEWVEKMTIQTGIDGYRVTAERTGEYVGGDAPVYGPRCRCRNARLGTHVSWAEVTVRRIKGSQVFTTSERADYDEYVQLNRDGAPQGMWAKMPRRMLAKCAEALALRRAFPGLFEGVYTSEEMAQADTGSAELVTVEPSPTKDAAGEPALGDPCLACADLGLRGFYRKARGGPLRGQLQCNGRDREGKWCNHAAPTGAPDQVASDPSEIPW